MVLPTICQHVELRSVGNTILPLRLVVLTVGAECTQQLTDNVMSLCLCVVNANGRCMMARKKPCMKSSGAYSDIPATKLHHLRAEVPSDLQPGESRVVYMKRLQDCGFYRYFRIYCEKLGYSMRRMSTCKFKLTNDGSETDVITLAAKRGAK